MVYLVLQLGLGFWIARRVASEDDYLLAGRSLGFGLSLFTIFATWFGAETCLGSAGQAFSGGLSATTADPFGYAAALLLFGLLFAIPLGRRKLTTLADLFRQAYGGGVERVAVLLMVPTSVLWAAAQIRAFGQVLGATSDMNLDVTITIAAAVVIVYTAAGGLLADAWTDFIQGSVLIIGLVVLAGSALLSGDAAAVAEAPANKLTLVAAGTPLLEIVETWAVPIIGSLVAQELVARALAARHPLVARKAAVSASAMYLFIGIIPPLLGLMAAQNALPVDDPEHVLLAIAGDRLPQILYIVFAGALVSAILSTVDSALLVAGSLVAHNMIIPMAGIDGARKKLLVNRLAVVCAGLVAYALALGSESIYDLVVDASAFGTTSIFVITMFALYGRIGGPLSAYAALFAGTGIYAAGEYVGAVAEYIEYPYLTSLAVALAAYLVTTAATGRRLAA